MNDAIKDRSKFKKFLTIITRCINQEFIFCHVTLHEFNNSESNEFYIRCMLSKQVYMDLFETALLKLYKSNNAPNESDYDNLIKHNLSNLNPEFRNEIIEFTKDRWLNKILR